MCRSERMCKRDVREEETQPQKSGKRKRKVRRNKNSGGVKRREKK